MGTKVLEVWKKKQKKKRRMYKGKVRRGSVVKSNLALPFFSPSYPTNAIVSYTRI